MIMKFYIKDLLCWVFGFWLLMFNSNYLGSNEYDYRRYYLTQDQGLLFCNKNYLLMLKKLYSAFNEACPYIDFSQFDGRKEKITQVVLVDNVPLGVIKYGVRQYRNVLIWELANLLRLEKYVCPTIAINEKVVFQKHIKAKFIYDLFGGHSYNDTLNIKLIDYWLANLCVYVFGMGDVTCNNVAISDEQNIMFVDNKDTLAECDGSLGGEYLASKSLVFINDCLWPWQNHLFISCFYINNLLDWSHLTEPLTNEDVNIIKDKISKWRNLRKTILNYNKSLPREICLNNRQITALLERIQRVLLYDFKEGCCFKDFLNYLFPTYYCGANELREIVSQILQREINISQAYLIISGYKVWYNFYPEYNQMIEQWILNRPLFFPEFGQEEQYYSKEFQSSE